MRLGWLPGEEINRKKQKKKKQKKKTNNKNFWVISIGDLRRGGEAREWVLWQMGDERGDDDDGGGDTDGGFEFSLFFLKFWDGEISS